MNAEGQRHWMIRALDLALLALVPAAGIYGIAYEYGTCQWA